MFLRGLYRHELLKGLVYTERQRHCSTKVATLVSLKTMESLQNGMQSHSGGLGFASIVFNDTNIDSSITTWTLR